MATTPDDLWRAVHSDEMPKIETDTGPVSGVLTPTMSRKKIGETKDKYGKVTPRFREPDVTITDGKVQPGGGTSLFDKDRFFKSKVWQFFKIPKDTPVPESLALIGPDWNKRFKANHYMIGVRVPISPEAYEAALDNYARAAYAKRYTDART